MSPWNLPVRLLSSLLFFVFFHPFLFFFFFFFFFFFKLLFAETVPAKSNASGPGLAKYPTGIPSGTFVSFTVFARTASGAQRKTGGDTVTFTASGAPITSPVVDNHDGTYTLTYMQNLADANFTVAVKINGGAIMGSPFTVYVNGDK
jgi:hypothetical protein